MTINNQKEEPLFAHASAGCFLAASRRIPLSGRGDKRKKKKRRESREPSQSRTAVLTTSQNNAIGGWWAPERHHGVTALQWRSGVSAHYSDGGGAARGCTTLHTSALLAHRLALSQHGIRQTLSGPARSGGRTEGWHKPILSRAAATNTVYHATPLRLDASSTLRPLYRARSPLPPRRWRFAFTLPARG